MSAKKTKSNVPGPVRVPAGASGRKGAPQPMEVTGARRPAVAANVPAPLAATSTDDPHAIWQAAHDNFQAAFERGNALLDQLQDAGQRKVMNDTLDTLSNELTALNQEDMENHTISLQAATGQLGAGIDKLKELQHEIAKITGTIAEADKVAEAVGSVIGGLESFLSTFAV